MNNAVVKGEFMLLEDFVDGLDKVIVNQVDVITSQESNLIYLYW